MIVTPIYKKGDRLNPANYRAYLSYLSPGKIHFGFRPNRGTIDAVFITLQILEKYINCSR